MSIWLALLVPIAGIIIMAIWFRESLAWWELVLPIIASVIFIGISKTVTQKIAMTDTEYHGALIVKAQYYEYWETWVHKTCSRTYREGKTTYTTHYDCSYCDENRPRWYLVNSLGEKFETTQEDYNRLLRKWKGNPQFVELNRHINYHGSYGKDGDMYEFTWDNNPMTAESSTTEHSYENRIKAAHSSFDFVQVDKEDIVAYGLYEYPKVNGIKQEAVLGLDSVNFLSPKDKALMKQWTTYINGHYGKNKHVRVYYLIFANKPSIAGRYQEAYWEGGNDNELVICIGVNSHSSTLKWVYPFTWSPSRKIIPDMRSDIMKHHYFDANYIPLVTIRNIEREWKRKDFEEFSYISVDPPLWAKIMTWILTALITGGVCYWAITNDYVADEENTFKTKEKWRRW